MVVIVIAVNALGWICVETPVLMAHRREVASARSHGLCVYRPKGKNNVFPKQAGIPQHPPPYSTRIIYTNFLDGVGNTWQRRRKIINACRGRVRDGRRCRTTGIPERLAFAFRVLPAVMVGRIFFSLSFQIIFYIHTNRWK